MRLAGKDIWRKRSELAKINCYQLDSKMTLSNLQQCPSLCQIHDTGHGSRYAKGVVSAGCMQGLPQSQVRGNGLRIWDCFALIKAHVQMSSRMWCAIARDHMRKPLDWMIQWDHHCQQAHQISGCWHGCMHPAGYAKTLP